MVLSSHFAELSENKFSFFSVDINSLDELSPSEQEQIEKLKKDNGIVETPSLLFLNPQNLEMKYLYCGAEDLEASLVVSKMSVELD